MIMKTWLSRGFRGFKGFQKPGLQGVGPKIQVLSIASIVSTLLPLLHPQSPLLPFFPACHFPNIHSLSSSINSSNHMPEPRAILLYLLAISGSPLLYSGTTQLFHHAESTYFSTMTWFSYLLRQSFPYAIISFKILSEPGALLLRSHFTTPKTCYHITSQNISYHSFLQSFDRHLSTVSPNLPSVSLFSQYLHGIIYSFPLLQFSFEMFSSCFNVSPLQV